MKDVFGDLNLNKQWKPDIIFLSAFAFHRHHLPFKTPRLEEEEEGDAKREDYYTDWI